MKKIVVLRLKFHCMKRILGLLAIILLFHLQSSAQPALGINGLQVSPDTVVFNDFVTYGFFLQNVGDSAFSGTVSYYFTVNNDTAGPYFLDSTSQFFLSPNSSLQVVIQNHQVTGNLYAAGDNIVVIWPVANTGNVPTVDSGMVHLYVDSLLSIDNSFLHKKIFAFYNEQNQSILINYSSMEHEISEVSVINLSGQRLYSFSSPVKRINAHALPQNMYLLEVKTRTGAFITFKLICR